MRKNLDAFDPGRLVFAALLMLFSFGAANCEELSIPAPPANDYPIADYAGLFSPDQEKQLHEDQLRSYAEYDTPIVVVTILSMEEHGAEGWSFERFVYTWFNKWKIGKRTVAGELVNRGILLLLSPGDRRVRIELGADWGQRWDGHCKAIISGIIVPRFNKDDIPDGISIGVKALADMASAGPDGREPDLDSTPGLLAAEKSREAASPGAVDHSAGPASSTAEEKSENRSIGETLFSFAGSLWVLIGLTVAAVICFLCLYEWIQERKKLNRMRG